jgi:HAD superfamily hydrolase (TIGR01509 family)
LRKIARKNLTMLSGIRHFLFDLDGTLVDSSPLHEAAYRAALAPNHARLLAGFDYRAIAGLPTPTALAQLGVAEEDIPRLTQAKQAHYRGALNSLKPLPGAAELLAMLRERGAEIAIVTSASRASAQAALAATELAGFVALLVAAEDVVSAKPAPDPFWAALKLLDAKPSHSIAIEDALSGVLSARAAGLKVIGMHHEILRGVSDFYFSDFAALKQFLAKLPA